MTDLILNDNSKIVTMTSREIAELTGKAHFNVLVDIRKMLFELCEDELKFQAIYFDGSNRSQTEFVLDRELTDTLLTGYSALARRAVIARWHKLEGEKAKPDFTNPASAARAWAIQYEASQTLTIERDHAIATKAQIGDKRQATSMAKVAVANREITKLKALIGESTQGASVVAVENAMKRKFGAQDWRKLKSYCITAGLGIGRSFNPGMQLHVNTYPAAAWLEVFGVDLVDLFGEVMA